MKKIILLVALVSAVFASCSDDNSDDFPIEGLKLPESETLWEIGSQITIEGAGFTTASEIWLNAVTVRSTENAKVKAEVHSVSSSSITFIAPEVYGQQNIILNEGGKEYALGTLTFKAETEYIKMVSRITYKENGPTSYDTYFSYDEKGNILEIKEETNGRSTKTTYEYRKNEIYSEYWDYDVTQPDVLTFKLNDNGLITKFNYAFPDGTSDDHTYGYNADNQIIVSESGDGKYEITWTNENITKIKNISDSEELVFTYSQYKNKTNMDFCAYLSDYGVFEDPVLTGQGYFGKSNKHLPVSYDESYSGGSFGYTFEYTFDADGYVTTIKEYGRDDKKLKATYTIYYK